MIRVIGVRFRTAGKIYFFDPLEFDIRKGANVIVETARGIEFGTVVSGITEVEDEKVIQPLKPVLRIANERDMEQEAANKEKEKDAFKICLEKIRDHGLEMKLIDAEYTFDNNKVLFYFTADGRIDFRELVKDLASVFKTRIELRQIGVRDETKIVGGIGICGRPLCCHSYLADFVPVSIKMAKEQNLSLNPAKISGVCGRLMCCLKNEEETYEELNRRLPNIGDSVTTADGLTGEVQSVNVLRQLVKVIVNVGDEKEIKEYGVEQLQFRRKRSKKEKMELSQEELEELERLEEEERQELQGNGGEGSGGQRQGGKGRYERRENQKGRQEKNPREGDISAVEETAEEGSPFQGARNRQNRFHQDGRNRQQNRNYQSGDNSQVEKRPEPGENRQDGRRRQGEERPEGGENRQDGRRRQGEERPEPGENRQDGRRRQGEERPEGGENRQDGRYQQEAERQESGEYHQAQGNHQEGEYRQGRRYRQGGVPSSDVAHESRNIAYGENERDNVNNGNSESRQGDRGHGNGGGRFGRGNYAGGGRQEGRFHQKGNHRQRQDNYGNQSGKGRHDNRNRYDFKAGQEDS